MEDEEVSQVSTVWIFYSTGISVKSNLEVIPTENLLFFSSGSFSGTCITSGGKIPTYVLRNLCFYIKKKIDRCWPVVIENMQAWFWF